MKKVLIGLLALIAVFVIVVATRPAEMHVERSIDMAAPAEIPFGLVNDFHKFGEWSPWEKLDPAMKKTYDGPESGVGASYHWIGNSDVGEGRQTITESKPNEKVGMKLEFIQPFEATNQVTFTFAGNGDSTKVTWAMDGHNNFMAKAVGMFMDMEKMVSADFDKGLASMKGIAETEHTRRKEEAAKAAAEAAAAAAEAAAAAAAAAGDPAAVPAGGQAAAAPANP